MATAIQLTQLPADTGTRRRHSIDEAHAAPLIPPPTPNARPACFRSLTHELLFIFTAVLGVAMPSLLQGSTIVISSFVGDDLNMSTAEITWMTASSALTSGAFLLFFGKVADMFGRRGIFIGSLALFSVFALATGFARTAIAVDVLNGVLGLFCAAAIPAIQGIMGSIYEVPCRRKNYAFACFSAGNPLGFVFGSILSGVATELFSWRASFWMLAIIYAAAVVIAYYIVPTDDEEKLPLTMESLKQFDAVGAVLTIGGIALFSTAISTGPDATEGWKSPYILTLLILGTAMMVGFVWWECRFPYPLMPMNLWRDKEFSLLMAILLLGFLAFPPMTFFVALYFQKLLRFSSLMTALHMLPMAVIAGLILHKISNKLLMGIGAAAYTIAFTLVAVQRSGDSYWAFVFPALTLVVIGADFEFNVANMYVLSSLPKSQQSIAGSIFQSVTKLSVTIGLGIGTAIFRSVSENPAKVGYYGGDPFEPYAATFWFAMAATFVSLLMVPFLKINTQGHESTE